MSAMSDTVSQALSRQSLAAWTTSRTRAGTLKRVEQYVDMLTGEIMPADKTSLPVIDLRTKQDEKDTVLGSLRSEVRTFAYFVLSFANKRRGITPGIKTLCQWYADLHGKRADNIRRHIPKLEAAGILAGESLLGPLWQRTGGTARSHLGEETGAVNEYAKLRRAHYEGRSPESRKKGPYGRAAIARRNIENKSQPAWLVHAKPTGNVIAQNEYRALMARIAAPAIEMAV